MGGLEGPPTVEVFVADGAVYLSGLTFPAEGATEVAMTVKVGRVTPHRMDVQALP